MTEAIRLEKIHKSMQKRQILEDISFTVGQGDIFGYLGPNGAGKTTTMRIMLGLLTPDSGEAKVRGVDLSRDTEARGSVGVLLDRDGLYDRISAYDNLVYYARLYGVADVEKKVAEMLEFAGLTDRRDDKVGSYSKGMKRKLGLARALIHDPDLLFLDEPSAGLDPEVQKSVRDLLLHLSHDKKITIFLNSHDLDEVQRICSKVAIIQEGKIRVSDTLDHLRNRSDETEVQITLADNANFEKALALLQELDFASFRAKESNTVMTVALKKGRKSSELMTFLITKDVQVEEATVEKQSLEDIYIDIMHREAN